jgi:hypothetical protein
MKKFLTDHKIVWKSKDFLSSTILGIVFLLISFVANYFAGVYANYSQSNAVSDILLDHLPVYNVEFIFFEVFFLFLISVVLILIYRPKTIPFAVKSIALFILIRAAFITLTHLKEFPQRAIIDPNDTFQNIFTFGGDLFFSAHTGLPFLLALIFWKDHRLKILFLVASAFFASIVLLGHLHYSIDVFAAYFITYSIYKISERFFGKDFRYSDL